MRPFGFFRVPLLLLLTPLALAIAGVYIFVLNRYLPGRIEGIQNTRKEQRMALAQVQATADLKQDARIFLPLIPRLEGFIPTDEQAFEVTKQIRAQMQNIFAGQGRVDVGQPVVSQDVMGVRAVPLTIEGEGDIKTLGSLLEALKKLPTIVRVTSISLVSQSDVKTLSHIRVTAEFFLR